MLQRLRLMIQRFAYGRYGNDKLNILMFIVALAFYIMSLIFARVIFALIGFVILILCYFRMFSKNCQKRREELEKYLKIRTKIKMWFKLQKDKWRDRKTHKYFKCENCGKILRVPKGRGKIAVTCPGCKHETVKFV